MEEPGKGVHLVRIKVVTSQVIQNQLKLIQIEFCYMVIYKLYIYNIHYAIFKKLIKYFVE